MAGCSTMSYSREEAEGRALAYVGSVLLGIGILIFGSAALVCRELLRVLRERRAAAWQPTSGSITSGDVKAIHGRPIDYAVGNVGYAYSVEDVYYSGYLAQQFWDEQRAWTFVDSCQNHQVVIRFKPGNPKISVLALADLSNSGATELFRPIVLARPLGPWLTLLWSLRNVSDWAEGSLQRQASTWPSAEATVEYAEPRIADAEDRPHWLGELHYAYTVDGRSYSSSHYFRARGEDDAKELVEPWRGRKLIIHYFPGNPARSVFIEGEQLPSSTVA